MQSKPVDMKVGWFDTEKWEREYLTQKDLEFEIDFFDHSLTPENKQKAEGYDAVTVFVDSNIDQEVIECLDADVIVCRSTGFDHIDLDAASEKDIKVSNVPEYGGTTVAEHCFGLILSLSRKIYYGIRKVEKGDFSHENLRGFDLKNKKLGVVGTGTIGKNVIRIANGFEMNVVAYDPYPDKEAAAELGYDYVDLDELVREANIISLNCPLTDSTHHLLSEQEFEKMEDTMIINTARGEIIDTAGLIKGLKNDSVKAAGLDVLEEEFYLEKDKEDLNDLDDESKTQKIMQDHVLMEREDVIVTPHNAFNSIEALHRIEDTTIENLKDRENIVNN
jgi:D-lactate dehydrogenase